MIEDGEEWKKRISEVGESKVIEYGEEWKKRS